ncbi:hypothetical protein K503DRAFT_794615 [Rhizopogon vinicolor AM-OR11-026]|uniref:Uncharacterized protein n=1 Tax=Rhizopogon vinicolor AM-OR11-026 TaxID=1314800 RepID=A0A1B7MK79_9AGAM|nr:hypothetical protein K503DRAFT_794615 [Rhizopogon vinicolor AM-OR11-026]
MYIILAGRICDEYGQDIPPETPPPPRRSDHDLDDWTPYNSHIEFEIADFIFHSNQMSGGDIDVLLNLWAATLAPHDELSFRNHTDLYNTIDSTPLADATPPWMEAQYEAWFRDPRQLVKNLLSNPNFEDEFDYSHFHEYDADDNHCFQDFMSGDWAWKQADLIISEHPDADGSMFVPIILGSNKTTVSVAMGNDGYWPVYLSIGNIHNNVRRAHQNGVVLLGLLAIPKTDNEYSDDAGFCKFRQQLFHSSLLRMLQSLKPGMTKPEVVRCLDGHFRHAIYGLGPYIADYPEQALLACVVQGWCAKCLAPSNDLDGESHVPCSQEHTNALVEMLELGVLWDKYGLPCTEDFPHVDIHELLSPDILHQLIKGTFKDHLVTWVQHYLFVMHSECQAKKILDDIDQRIAIVAPFSGLRCFPEGRGFKQWTGDNSKALMKFCYIARQNVQDMNSLRELQDTLDRFHHYRTIFEISGVRPDSFNLPQQHSLVHYYKLIHAFGAPNGLCSSITESKHIKAIKEPWRRSNHHNAIGKMLLTNQRLDKLTASSVDFEACGMLTRGAIRIPGSIPGSAAVEEDDDDEDTVPGPRVLAHVELAKTIAQRKVNAAELVRKINQPDLIQLIRSFLYEQLLPHPSSDSSLSGSSPLKHRLPFFDSSISVYTSALATFYAPTTFYAPSDLCGTGGMRRERICAISSWRGGAGRYDCVFVETDPAAQGMLGLDVAQVRLFFSFAFRGQFYPYPMMTIVRPEFNTDGSHKAAVIHLDTIVCATHLIAVYGRDFLPKHLSPTQSLDIFQAYYINKYIDHHEFEIAF